MRRIILLITGCVVGFLLCSMLFKHPQTNAQLRQMIADRGILLDSDGNAQSRQVGLISGKQGPVFLNDGERVHSVIIRAFQISPSLTRLLVTQVHLNDGRPLPKTELAQALSKRIDVVCEGSWKLAPSQAADNAYSLEIDAYLIGQRDAETPRQTRIYGDDFINLPRHVYFSAELAAGIPVGSVHEIPKTP